MVSKISIYWQALFLSFALFGFSFFGCGKTNTVDSVSVVSFVNITDVRLDAQKAVVSVQWEYEGAEAIHEFHIFRKIGDQEFEQIGNMDGGGVGLSGQLAFQDPSPIAGEQAAYRVDLIVGERESIRSQSFPLLVPGVLIQKVQADEAQASIQLAWTPVDNGILSYEVFRQIDDETPRSVYASDDLSKRAFVDGPLIGNHEYQYVIRSLLTGGRILDSRPQTVELYPSVYSRAVTQSVSNRVRLNWFNLVSVGAEIPMACVFGASKTQIHQLDYQVIVTPFETGNETTYMVGTDANAEIVDLSVSGLNPATVSFAGPSAHQPNAPAFITGVDVSGQVIVKAFTSSSVGSPYDTPVSVSVSWLADAQDVRTSSYYAGSGHLFISAGKTLKVFDPDFQAVGSIQLEAIPYDLLTVTGNVLWASFPEESRLSFAMLAFDQNGQLMDPIWQDVVLPDHTRPMGLDLNAHGQIAVLDGENNKVLILDQQGAMVTHIGGLIGPFDQEGMPEGDIMTGLSSQGKSSVYVVNADGRLFFYGDNSL